MAAVTDENAYRFSDNYTIQTVNDPKVFYGCEHNQQEANAVAKYISSLKGLKMEVVKNSRSEVDAAKSFCREPLRYQFRDEAFKALGVV